MDRPPRLLAATLIWYLAFGWMMLRDPRAGRVAAAPLPFHPPPVVNRSLPTAPTETLEWRVLRRASTLSSARIGYSGQASAEGMAWRALAARADADVAFAVLAESRDPVPAFYGLVWLYARARPAYEAIAARWRERGGTLRVQQGCVVYEAFPVDDALREIETGDWFRDLLGAPLPQVY